MMPLGLLIGSFTIPLWLRIGRHTAFISVNILGLAGCIISQGSSEIFPDKNNNYYCVMAGRLIYGGSAGILFGLVPKMIMEYLSVEEFSKGYGLIPNLAIEFFKTGFVVLNLIYMFIKKDDDNESDWYWKFNFGIPAMFLIFSILLFGLFSRKDSFSHIMEREKNAKDKE
jgi:MFS family permease